MAKDKHQQQRAAAKKQRRDARKRDEARRREETAKTAGRTALPAARAVPAPLSETLEDFAASFTALAGAVDPPLLRRMMLAAAGVWNSTLGRPVDGPCGMPPEVELADLAAAMGTSPVRARRALEGLEGLKRSQPRFRDDPREFLEVSTRPGVGEIRLRVIGSGPSAAMSPASEVLAPGDPRAGAWATTPGRPALPAPDERARSAMADLVDFTFTNGAVEALARQLADEPDRVGLARRLALAYAHAGPGPDGERTPEVDHLAAAAIAFLAGADPARAAAALVLDEPGALANAQVRGLAWAFGIDHGKRAKQAEPGRLETAARNLARRMKDVFDILPTIAMQPPLLACPIARAALAERPERGQALLLAALGASSALPAEVQAIFRAHLAEGGEEGLAILAAIDAAPDAAEPRTSRLSEAVRSALPHAWPVERAHASSPDEDGQQLAYLVRQEPGGRRVLVGGWVTPRRGLIDFVVHPNVTDAFEHDLRDEEDREPVWPVDPAYVRDLLGAGVATARTRGFPLPLGYLGLGGLLAGVPGAAPDLVALVAGLADPVRLPWTGALWHHRAFATRFYYPHDPAAAPYLEAVDAAIQTLAEPEEPRPETYPPDVVASLDAVRPWPVEAAGLAVVDAIARASLPGLLPADERLRWRDLLRHDAYLFARGGQPVLAGLAATAAWAIDPESGIALADQPFVRDMLRMSALWDYMD